MLFKPRERLHYVHDSHTLTAYFMRYMLFMLFARKRFFL
jgi:hypothetical protein